MKKIIKEEILRQLQLINFDRSKTLNENDYYQGKTIIDIKESEEKFTPPNPDLSVFGDTLPPGAKQTLIRQSYIKNLTPGEVLRQQQYQKKYDKEHPCRVDSYIDDEPDYYNTKCPGRSAFYRLNYQIEGDGTWFSSWGTDENEILEALKLLKTREDYEDLRWWINEQTDFPMTVVQWIQANEFSEGAAGSKYSGKNLFGGNALQYYQYQTNDYFLEQMVDILQKFSNEEVATWEWAEDEWEIAIPPAAREAIHVVLPLATLAVTILSGGVLAMTLGEYLLAFGIEVLDATIYYYADKDMYAAGLSLVFAFVTPFDGVLKRLVLKCGDSLIYKLATNTGQLTDEEFELIMLNSRNFLKYERLAKIGMRVSAIRMTVQRLTNLNDFLRFISWLVAKGYMLTSMATNILATIGIGFVTWEKINDMYFKFCNSMELKQMEKSKTWILQKLSALGPYFQPYSTPCNEIATKEMIAKTIKEYSGIQSYLKMYFEKIINGNIVLTMEQSSSYLKKDIAYFQYVLYFMGLDYKAKPIEDIRKDIQKKDGKYNEQQCRDMLQQMLTGGMDMVRLSSHPECDTYFKNDFKTNSLSSKQKKEIDDINKKYPYNPNVKPSEYTFDYGVKVAYKWGTFDEQTKIMLKEFQKRYKLSTIDGTFNPETAKKMLEFLNNGSLSKIKDYGKLSNDIEDIELLKQITLDAIKEKEKTVTQEEKKYNEKLNKIKFEDEKKKLDEKFENSVYDPTEFPNHEDDTITVEISKYDPNSDGITNTGLATQFMKK